MKLRRRVNLLLVMIEVLSVGTVAVCVYVSVCSWSTALLQCHGMDH